MSFPNMMRIRQYFDAPTVKDIRAAVREEVVQLNLGARVEPGQSVAVSVGSRGINNIALITKSLVEELKTFLVLDTKLSEVHWIHPEFLIENKLGQGTAVKKVKL